jgi:2-polyprenyl-6-methoxyphenol hydroxylase-like FAD-dependent oxidoreductase
MTEHAVAIAGAGPTGLMLAGELALAGVDVAIVERRASQDLPRLARRSTIANSGGSPRNSAGNTASHRLSPTDRSRSTPSNA